MPQIGDFKVEFQQGLEWKRPYPDLTRATMFALGKASRELRNLAREIVPVQSGKLKKSITTIATHRTSKVENWAWGITTESPYAPFVEHGTGLYGPLKRKIYAPGWFPMMFQNSEGTWVRTWSTKGQHAQHFMQKAVKKYTRSKRVGRIIEEELDKILKGDVI